MYGSDFINMLRNRYLLAFLLMGALVFSSACREDLTNVPGTKEEIFAENLPGALGENTEWLKMAGTPNEILAMAKFKGDIYLAGTFDSGNGNSFIVRYDGQQVVPLLTGSFSPGSDGIYALHANDTALFIGGEFAYTENGSTYVSAMYFDGQTIRGNTTWQIVTAHDIVEFNNQVWFAGEMAQNVTTTHHVMTLNPPGMGTALPMVSFEVFDAHVFEESLHVVGRPYSTGNNRHFARFQSGAWTYEALTVSSFFPNTQYEAYTLGDFNSYLFVFAEDQNGEFLLHYRQRDSDWFSDDEVSVWGSADVRPCFAPFKDQFFMGGSRVNIDGTGAVQNVSNVIRFRAGQWVSVGALKAAVYDLQTFDDQLYAATRDGLYVAIP